MIEPISQVTAKSIKAKKVSEKLSRSGYAHIKRKFYLKKLDKKQLKIVQNTYKNLENDTYSDGNRQRAYTKLVWDVENNKAIKAENNNYSQSEDYNPKDGGKVRKFKDISLDYLNNPVVGKLVINNIEIAKNTDLVKFDPTLEIGLHQIRYRAKPNSPAYSSPMWLHKDDEPLVFVHLFNLSKNTLGGDNIIAYKNKPLNVLRLAKPMETLVVNQAVYHAVTPMGTSNKKSSYRDILLVTFFNNKNKAKQEKTEEESRDLQKIETDVSSIRPGRE